MDVWGQSKWYPDPHPDSSITHTSLFWRSNPIALVCLSQHSSHDYRSVAESQGLFHFYVLLLTFVLISFLLFFPFRWPIMASTYLITWPAPSSGRTPWCWCTLWQTAAASIWSISCTSRSSVPAAPICPPWSFWRTRQTCCTWGRSTPSRVLCWWGRWAALSMKYQPARTTARCTRLSTGCVANSPSSHLLPPPTTPLPVLPRRRGARPSSPGQSRPTCKTWSGASSKRCLPKSGLSPLCENMLKVVQSGHRERKHWGGRENRRFMLLHWSPVPVCLSARVTWNSGRPSVYAGIDLWVGRCLSCQIPCEEKQPGGSGVGPEDMGAAVWGWLNHRLFAYKVKTINHLSWQQQLWRTLQHIFSCAALLWQSFSQTATPQHRYHWYY